MFINLIVKIVIGIIVILAITYRKASPDTACVITGLREEPKVVIGKSFFYIPFLQRIDTLDLKLMKINIKTKDLTHLAFKNSKGDFGSTVTLKIGESPKLLNLAIQNFLNKDTLYISKMVTDVIEGNLREIIGTSSIFSRNSVNSMITIDLEKMGIATVSFNVYFLDIIDNYLDLNNSISSQLDDLEIKTDPLYRKSEDSILPKENLNLKDDSVFELEDSIESF